MRPEPGLLVTPTIRLVEPVDGESVWVGEHLSLDLPVAVKLMGGDARNAPETRERFRREAALAARMKGPHVVQIYDLGELEEGTPFIVMEWLEGETLCQRLAGEPLPLSDVVLLVTQVAEALEGAHDRDVVHGDIDPANLFLVATGDELFVKVLNFRVATEGGDPSVDCRALAVCAYRALTCHVPRDKGDLDSRVSDFRDDIPQAVDEFFARAFSAEPEVRHDSVRELAEDLVAAAEGDGASSSPEIDIVGLTELGGLLAAPKTIPWHLIVAAVGAVVLTASVAISTTKREAVRAAPKFDTRSNATLPFDEIEIDQLLPPPEAAGTGAASTVPSSPSPTASSDATP